jgi:glycosyltransferase involved in cell wall biosynthesis
MYPDMAVGLGYLDDGSAVAKLWDRAMQSVYRDADRIVVLGDSMEQRLERKMGTVDGFEADKIRVIPNWEDPEFIRPVDKENNEFAAEHGSREQFTLVYSGNIGRYHHLETAIDAVKILEERGRDDIHLLVIGEGGRKDEHRRRVRAREVQNVTFLPFQPKERLPESLTCGDASLVAIDGRMEGMCVSSKLYSSLAAGQPILAVVGEGDEVAEVVREHGCGVQVSPGDPQSAANVLECWADDPSSVDRMGDNARECFEDNFTKRHAVERYRVLLEEMAVA